MQAHWSSIMFGFGFSKEKSRANAERYLQQNKLLNAISEYEKILKVEPHDLAIVNTIGDIYGRLGQNEKAIERFRIVGEAYASDGFLLKAIAMYKKITKLDANGLSAMEKLAELYRKQGLVSDARSVLLQAAEVYTRKGQTKETLRLLKQLVQFDPENVQVITRTADLMTQGGQKEEAKQMLSQTASTLVERHALDPAQKILDRLIALDRTNLHAQELRAQVILELGNGAKAVELYEAIPDLDSRDKALRNLLSAQLQLGNLDAAIQICRKLMSLHQDPDGVLKVAACLYKENDTLRALALYNEFSDAVLARDKEDVVAHLQGAVSRVRSNPEALQTLYSLFQRAGDNSMNAEILELLAHASVQNNQLERARDTYKQLIALEPENASHIQGYRQVCARLTPVAPSASGGGLKSDDEPRTLEEFLSADEPALPQQSYSSEIEEQIDAALTEAEICESFSSKARGISTLELALRSAPDDLRMNRTLAMLYGREGDSTNAARCYNNMHRVLEALGESEAAGYYANLAGAGQTTTWESNSEFSAQDFDLGAADGGGNTEEIDLSSEWESVWQDAPIEVPAASATPQPNAQVVASPATSADDVSELLEEVRFCLVQQIWSEAETAIGRLAAACPEHPELPQLRAQLQQGHPAKTAEVAPAPRYAPVEVIDLSDEFPSVRQDSVPQEVAPAASLAAPTLSAAPAPAPTLSSFAAELDAELGDNFILNAQPRREARPSAPRAEVLPLPSAVALSSAVAPVAATPLAEVFPSFEAPVFGALVEESQVESAPLEAASLEAAGLLPEEAAAPEAFSVFGDLVRDFERDLAAPEKEDDDPETHFNLGIAFREMGLLDEAIGELQKVCRMAGQGLSAERAQQAFIWLATCFVEKSVPEASFKWFQRALDAATDEESRTAVNYELASAYEAAGYKREALQHFMEVYGNNIDYRDVSSRIRDLRGTV
jgi:tetratricopeptide (TPR) repeat protein